MESYYLKNEAYTHVIDLFISFIVPHSERIEA